ncbi:hypothetical protein ACFPPA_06140 [Rhodanobacter ginsengisoli]|uniref:PEP-CTERM protein-sorting domain-containing protein n=1 Tax=Rhodanobacter ginsengisoli TaxID=418646 RepID=A0ABW0QKS2_9GAMM
MKMTYGAALLAAVALPLVSLDAGAVTYYWFPTTRVHESPLIAYGQIDINNEAAAKTYDFYHYSGGPADPSSPFDEIFLEGAGLTGLRPQIEAGDEVWYIYANLAFGDLMTGDMSVGTIDTTFSMSTSGSQGLWTIANFLSDDSEWGCSDPSAPCSATGYWAVDESAVPPMPVPEPDTFAAFGILVFTLLGGDAARRWRRAHRQNPGQSSLS